MKIENYKLKIGLIALFFLLWSNQAAAGGIQKPLVLQQPNFLTLATGLVGWWTFDGPNMVQNVADTSGQGFNGFLLGNTATSTLSGRLGQALTFDGKAAYVNIVGFNGVQSISFWMREATSTATSTTQTILSLNGTQSVSATTSIKANGFVSPTYYIDGAASTTASIWDSNWHHVVITTSTAINASAINLGRIGTTYYFEGTLDDVRTYSRVLSATDVNDLYILGAGTKVNSTVGVSNALINKGLVAWWTFDGKNMTSLTSAADLTGNGETGTVNFQKSTTTVLLTLRASTWTVPENIVNVKAEVWSGGGGGGGAIANRGSGGAGAGGSYSRAAVGVIPGTVMNLYVGPGGSAGVSGGANGGAGEYSWFNSSSTVLALPGAGGVTDAVSGGGTAGGATTTAAGNGIAGAGVPVGDVMFFGSGGAAGRGGSGNGGGGGGGGAGDANSATTANGSTQGNGGATGGGNGGAGATTNTTAGSNGSVLGGGGGGGFGAAGGGTGSQGQVKLTGWGLDGQVSGKIGQALLFDGIADNVNAGVMAATVQSVSFWVKMSTSTTQNILALNTTQSISATSTIKANGFVSPIYYVDGVLTGSPAISDTGWHHLVVTTTSAITANAVTMGVIGGKYFCGCTLDDVRLYGRVLSAADVTDLYGLGAQVKRNISLPGRNSLSGPLVGWWTFDGPKMLQNVTNSIVSGPNGFLLGTTATSSYPGKEGQALVFDGKASYVSIGSAGSGIQSVAFWMREATSTATSTTQSIMSFNSAQTISATTTIFANGFAAPAFYIDGVASTSPTISNSAWHQVVITTATPFNASAMNLGRIGTTYFYEGMLDDVRLYSTALSAADVLRLYNMQR